MVDEASLAAIGAAIVGFGIVAFVFRIQRELQLQEARDLRLQELQGTLDPRLQEEVRKLGWRLFLRELEDTLDPELQDEMRKLGWKLRWIPWADRLLIVAVTAALLLVLFPIALAEGVSGLWGGRLPAAACSASLIALAGYIPALLAHYRFGPGKKWIWFGAYPRYEDRHPGDPAEKIIVVISALLGIFAAVGSFILTG